MYVYIYTYRRYTRYPALNLYLYGTKSTSYSFEILTKKKIVNSITEKENYNT